MVGRDTAELDQQAIDGRIVAFTGGGQWTVAREPIHKDGTGVGIGQSFAKEMLAMGSAEKVGLIPCAEGRSPLACWVKGGYLYEDALSRAREASKYGILKAMLWHQGEQDSLDANSANTYEARLKGMFRDLRDDLRMPELPIVIGQLGVFFKERYADIVKDALSRIAKALPFVALAGSQGLSDMGDCVHFSTAAQREFGVRYALALKHLEDRNR